MSWTALAVLSGGAYAFKLAGVMAGERFAERLAPVTALLPAALFSALIVTMAMGDGPSLVVDARLIGVAAGALAVARRAPMVVVIMVAMGVTALVRVMA
ncbi:MAG: AzlD domain-containing protein [Actinomycetota bacterium]|nr:AzlD domain-containing protein [Actinomycetota bacterium]